MEGEPEEPALTTRRQALADVQERITEQLPVPHDPHLAALLGHEDAPAAIAGVRDRERRRQPVDHGLEVQRDAVRVERTATGRLRLPGRIGRADGAARRDRRLRRKRPGSLGWRHRGRRGPRATASGEDGEQDGREARGQGRTIG